VPPFYVMDVWLAAAERDRTHGDLVNLSAGQPSAGAPAAVRAAAAAALLQNQLGYTVALGIPELRDAIAGSYQDRHGIVVDRDDVVATTGSSGGFLLAFLACFDVGDRVVVTSPGYPCYRNILSALGCEVVDLQCGPETRFQPTAQMLAALDPPVRGVVVASPANPTGTVIGPDELAAIAAWCDETGVQLISDEVYHGLIYRGAPDTSCAWETSRNAIVVNSFSKYFAMTGWRLGYLAAPEAVAKAVDSIQSHTTANPSSFSQRGALAALKGDQQAVSDMREEFDMRRNYMIDRLSKIPNVTAVKPQGAFYVLLNISQLGLTSQNFADRLLSKANVAVVPGAAFGDDRTIRLSYATSIDIIKKGLDRLQDFCRTL